MGEASAEMVRAEGYKEGCGRAFSTSPSLARRIDAAEAERIGLVSRVVPAEKLQDEARAVAKAIAK